MQLGRTHRAQMRFPIHFSAPDRSRTYIGETADISSNGFSVQVRTDDPLPTIILAGILPTEIAGDSILCKARVVWQGGLAGGIKKASYKITSIARKSQERLDQLIQTSVIGLIAELQELPLFMDCSREDLEALLHLSRSRDLPPDTILYEDKPASAAGLFVVLEGEMISANPTGGPRVFGPGSVMGQWTDSALPPEPESARTRTFVRFLHLPTTLTRKIRQEVPAIAPVLRNALGRSAPPHSPNVSGTQRRKMKLNVLKELQEIPTLPTVFNIVMDCIEDPEATARDLAQVIRKDQSLTAKILKTVNSALYSFPRRISSVNEAVVMLGMNQTASLAMTAMLLNTLVDPKRPQCRPEAFWEHSLGSAYIAQAIAECLKGKGAATRRRLSAGVRAARGGALGEADSSEPGAPPSDTRSSAASGAARGTSRTPVPISTDRLFTFAVIHDIGLIAMYVKFPEQFCTVRDALSQYGSFHRAELDLLEVDHCQLGYRIAQAWRLPEPIPTVIAEHHLPQIWADEIKEQDRLIELLREDPLVTLISLADLMTRHCAIGMEQDLQPPAIPEVFLKALGLTEEDAGEILSEGPLIKEKAETFFRGVTVS